MFHRSFPSNMAFLFVSCTKLNLFPLHLFAFNLRQYASFSTSFKCKTLLRYFGFLFNFSAFSIEVLVCGNGKCTENQAVGNPAAATQLPKLHLRTVQRMWKWFEVSAWHQKASETNLIHLGFLLAWGSLLYLRYCLDGCLQPRVQDEQW